MFEFYAVMLTLLYCSCNTRTLWDLWWSGNAALRYQPYRKIQSFDLHAGQVDKVKLSKARFVMNHLIEQEQCTEASVRVMAINERDQLFARAFINLYMYLETALELADFDARRYGDRSYLTVYDLIKEFDKATAAEAMEE